jgi:hypothetical protein
MLALALRSTIAGVLDGGAAEVLDGADALDGGMADVRYTGR